MLFYKDKGVLEVIPGRLLFLQKRGCTMCSVLGYCGRNGDYNEVLKALLETKSRGPDDSRVINTGNGWIGFNRLSIMGLTQSGMQPFVYGNGTTCVRSDLKAGSGGYEMPDESELVLACNGEIYGFRPLKEKLVQKGYSFISDSDCEILPALYREYGTDMFNMLDAEFALVMYDRKEDSYIAARDPIGIRPLYYGIREDGTYVFASEPKNLTSLVKRIMPFPPGYYFKDGVFSQYREMAKPVSFHDEDLPGLSANIHDLLYSGVKGGLIGFFTIHIWDAALQISERFEVCFSVFKVNTGKTTVSCAAGVGEGAIYLYLIHGTVVDQVGCNVAVFAVKND